MAGDQGDGAAEFLVAVPGQLDDVLTVLDEALGAACWDARQWLGRPGLDDGASADLLCYSDDPRKGPAVLNRPDLVILGGQVF